MSEQKKQELQSTGLVAWPVFDELIGMDEDEEGFSKTLFQTFVDQFKETIDQIKDGLASKNLDQLSSLGHYLKGSAAALGLVKISTQCERIQNYGRKNNFDNFQLSSTSSTSTSTTSGDTTTSSSPPSPESDDYWLLLIEDALKKANDGYDKSIKALNEYFDDEL